MTFLNALRGVTVQRLTPASSLTVAAVWLGFMAGTAQADLRSCRTLSEKGVHAAALNACSSVAENVSAQSATRGTALYYRANSRYSTRDIEGALDDINGAIDLNPGFGPAHALRGAIRLRTGDSARAEADYDRALELGFADPGVRSGRASARFERGDIAGAAEDLQAVVDAAPRNAVSRLRLAIALDRLGRTEEALEQANRAISINADYTAAYGVRAKIRGESGDLDGALEDYARAETGVADGVRHLVGKADILARAGRRGDALATLEDALQIEPGNRTANLLKADLHETAGELASARAALAPLAGADAGVALRRARLAIGTGDFGTAVKDYDTAIRLDPANGAAFFERGQLHERAERWGDAIADFDRAEAIDSGFRDRGLALLRGKAKFRDDDFAGALADLDAEISRQDSAEPRLWRALVHAGLGQYDDAERDARRLVELEPGRARSHAVLGDVLLNAGRLEEGRTAHERALALSPDFPPSLQRIRELDANR